jgi:hypothetical protein
VKIYILIMKLFIPLFACLLLVSCSTPVPSSAKAPPLLHVEGNRLVANHGRAVWLQGLNVPSLEWSPCGEQVLKSIQVGIADWHANVIRLPLSQDRWFGKAPHQDDQGQAYRKLVDEVVAYCSSHQAYVVIDLHWSDAGVWGKSMRQHNMPDTNSATFWQDAAKRYANHPAVLFDLYNEPHNVTWEVWRSGGQVKEKSNNGDAPAYESPGMQGLLNTVRQTGAKNVVIAGGLDWAYDLSGILNGFALQDKDGNGVMYAAHIYPWKKDWDNKVGRIAEKYPVFVGEVGCRVEKKQEDPYTWAPDVLGYIQQKKLHWTGWCFHPSASPCLVQDWNYKPTPYWGAFAQSALGGKQFTPTRTR